MNLKIANNAMFIGFCPAFADSITINAENILKSKPYTESEKKKILKAVNEYNIGFLEKITNLAYFEGTHKYSADSIKDVLSSINKETVQNANKIFSGDVSKLDLLPYELINKINPKAAQKQANNNLGISGNLVTYPQMRLANISKTYNNKQYEPANLDKKRQLENIFAGTMKEIHLENSTNPEVIEIEKKMKDLGINVTFADDLETAKVIYNTCKSLKEKGTTLPKEIILMTPHNSSTLGFTPLMRKGFEKNAQIFIKKGLGEVKSTSNPMFKEIGLNHFTDDTPAGTFTHELGHWHHNQNRLNDSDSQKVWQHYINNNNEMSIAKKVSAHAMTDPTGKEFVAEVYAGMCKGITYDEEVMTIYRALNGAEINQ